MILIITLSVIVITCLIIYYRLYSTFSKNISVETIPLTALITIHNNAKSNSKIIVNNIEVLLKHEIPAIIIDDGSTDQSIQFLQENITHRKLSFITLNNQGKYNAIQSTLKMVRTSHFLMIDADVKLTQNTIVALQKVNSKYDWVQTGIVHEKPKSLIQGFTFIDQLLLQKIAFLTTNSTHSIIGVGACARINKEKYFSLFEKNKLRYGGDMLIINKFNKANQLMLPPTYDITTTYPPTFKSLLSQRKRWASNNKNSSVTLMTIIGALLWLILLFTFPISLIFTLLGTNLSEMFIVLPIFGTFLLFLHQRINLINLFLFTFYLIFGWLFYIIILILITFGQFLKQKN